jgi:hypothetical protein
MTDVKLILDELMKADKLPEWCATYALAYLFYVSEGSKTWTPPSQ